MRLLLLACLVPPPPPPVQALLDHFVGDSVFGDVCCIIVGLSIVLYIRLSGFRLASFWPNS